MVAVVIVNEAAPAGTGRNSVQTQITSEQVAFLYED
jgi:hypothetical protein